MSKNAEKAPFIRLVCKYCGREAEVLHFLLLIITHSSCNLHEKRAVCGQLSFRQLLPIFYNGKLFLRTFTRHLRAVTYEVFFFEEEVFYYSLGFCPLYLGYKIGKDLEYSVFHCIYRKQGFLASILSIWR